MRVFCFGYLQRPLVCGYFCPFITAGFTKIAQAALSHGAVDQLQNNLRCPAGLSFSDAMYYTDGAGQFVNHDFAEKTFARGGIFYFGHGVSLWQKSHAFNV